VAYALAGHAGNHGGVIKPISELPGQFTARQCSCMAHLVQHRAVVLALAVFGKAEGDDVPECQRLAGGRVPLELLDVRHDVDDVEDGAIWRARLQSTTAFSSCHPACGRMLVSQHAPAYMQAVSTVRHVQQWLGQRADA
jgi:hypothetical protein